MGFCGEDTAPGNLVVGRESKCFLKPWTTDKYIQGQAKSGLKIAGMTNKEGHCSDEKERGLQGGILSPLYWERKSISPSSFLCLLFLLLVFKSLVLRRRLSVFQGVDKGGFAPLIVRNTQG